MLLPLQRQKVGDLSIDFTGFQFDELRIRLHSIVHIRDVANVDARCGVVPDRQAHRTRVESVERCVHFIGVALQQCWPLFVQTKSLDNVTFKPKDRPDDRIVDFANKCLVIFRVLLGSAPHWVRLFAPKIPLEEKQSLKRLNVEAFPGLMTSLDKQRSVFLNALKRREVVRFTRRRFQIADNLIYRCFDRWEHNKSLPRTPLMSQRKDAGAALQNPNTSVITTLTVLTL